MIVTKVNQFWPARFELTRDRVLNSYRTNCALSVGSLENGKRWFYFNGTVGVATRETIVRDARGVAEPVTAEERHVQVGWYENKAGYGVWFTMEGEPLGTVVESQIL